MTLSFFAKGNPVGQPRSRASRKRKGVYDPGTADHWKQRVKEHLMVAWDGMPFTGPVRVDLVFFFERPKSHFKRDGTMKPAHDSPWHTKKPDRDNLEKAVLDALTDAGLWADDAAVCAGGVTKHWVKFPSSAKCWPAFEEPGCEIQVQSLDW